MSGGQPQSIDLRNAFSNCRDQGERETCAAFAVTAAHELSTARVEALSEEHALWESRESEDPGEDVRSVSSVLAGLESAGHAIASDWAYGRPNHSAGIPPSAAAGVAVRRRAGLGSWTTDTNLSIFAVAAALTAGFGVVLTLGVIPEAWHRAAADGWLDWEPAADEDPVGHAVAAVGVVPGSDVRDGSVIFRNSAGPLWGDAGYGYVSERYLQNYCWVGHLLGPQT